MWKSTTASEKFIRAINWQIQINILSFLPEKQANPRIQNKQLRMPRTFF